MTTAIENAPKSIRKMLFPVALSLLIAITIDMNIGSTVDIVQDFAISFYGVMLFTVVAIASIIGQYFVIKMIRGLNKEKEVKRRNIDILETIVKAVQYVLAGIIVIVLIQIIFTAHYYTHLLSAAATISYGLAVYLMSALAYWFLSWYRRNRSLVVLLYALSAIFITVNAVDTIVYYDVILTHKTMTISPQSEVIWETDFNPNNPMYIVSTLHAISLNCYFILAWGGTIFLLRHNIKRIGNVKFWGLITTPYYSL